MIKKLISTVLFLVFSPLLFADPEILLMWRPDTTSDYQRKVITPQTNYTISFDGAGIPVIVPMGLVSADIDTSEKLRGILTDENGTGAALFAGATNPSFAGLTSTAPISLSGVGTLAGTWIETPVAMDALVVDTTKANNIKSDNENRTITFSGSPADGQWWALTWINTHTSSVTVTLPAGILDGASAADVPSFTVPAAEGENNGRRTVVFQRVGSNTVIHQGGGGGSVSGWGDLTDIPAIISDIAALPEPEVDAIGFWDSSDGTFQWLIPGDGLSIVDNSITAPGYQRNGGFVGTSAYDANTLYAGEMDNDATVTLDLDAGQTTSFVLNVMGSPRTLTFPSAYRVGYSGGTITSLVLPVGRQWLSFTHDGGDIVLRDSLSEPDSSRTGTHASPTTTDPLSPTWSGQFHAVWYGAAGTINLPPAAQYDGRGVMIYNTGDFVITIDPDGSEALVRDGTVQTGGVSMTLSSGAGNYVSLISDSGRWITLGYKGTLSAGS